jgi:1-deoxy-D-xylulose-5-phosphate reductoisomerase
MVIKMNPDHVVTELVVLGATGSVGQSTLDLVRHASAPFRIVALTANRNIDLLYRQAVEFRPDMVAIADSDVADDQTCQKFRDLGIDVVIGPDSARIAVQQPHDLTIAGIVGAAGLSATFEAARLGRRIAIANKECVVCGGDLFIQMVKQHHATLLPIDSEHNAIFQIMHGTGTQHVDRLILTASGGPFHNWSIDKMASATIEQALTHPTWRMGKKISIDSATMMNKGLEIIEAHYLFDMPADKIDVLVHPQSIIHSMVEYQDGSILAQMGTADMRIPIAHALAWPNRMSTPADRLNFTALVGFSFETPDVEKFPCLRLARNALKCGKSAPIILNAANEVAVASFLDRRIGFLDIARIVEQTLNQMAIESVSDLAHILVVDMQARIQARQHVQKLSA